LATAAAHTRRTAGLKVCGIAYTGEEAQHQGWKVTF
jgi:hypothetical protein